MPNQILQLLGSDVELPSWGATWVMPLLITWAVLTLVLIGLLTYRGILQMHEEDTLFLTEAEKNSAQQQKQLNAKLDKLQPWVRGFGTASAFFIVVLIGVEASRVAMMLR